VEKIGKNAVTLSHGPVASMQWGEMTMEFAAPKTGIPPGIKEGDRVKFEFRQGGQGAFELTAIAPLESKK
jgi:Cu(I)/Ag(I) efflux system membrane fusion protein